MMQGSTGWICPKCGAIISPYDQTCAKCAPKTTWTQYYNFGPITEGTVRLQPISGTITIVGTSTRAAFGTFYATPTKTDAQKLAEAQADRDKYKRKAEKYSAWADKLIEFYEQLNDLTQELDELTNEPDEIEGSK